MKKFYCNGKKDFCHRNLDCNASETLEGCEFYDGKGGEYVEEEEGNDDEARSHPPAEN